MNNVISFSNLEWKTLLLLKQSMEYLATKNKNGRFTKVIRKEKEIYRTIIEDASRPRADEDRVEAA